MASVERKIMLTHVMNAVKMFLTLNTDVNSMSAGGVYMLLICLCVFSHCCIYSVLVYVVIIVFQIIRGFLATHNRTNIVSLYKHSVSFGCFCPLSWMASWHINPFKPSGAKWLHYKVFKAILV